MALCLCTALTGLTVAVWGLDFSQTIATFILWFSDILLYSCCCAWAHCAVSWLSLCQALAVTQMTSHLTSEYAGIQRGSWLTQCLPGAQVLWMHNKAKSSPLHHCARQLVRVDCANIMFGCLPTWPCACLQYSQTSSLCSYLSKGHCCTSLCKPKSSCHHSFQKAGFLLHIFSNKPFLFSLFLIVLSWQFSSC